MYYIGLDVHKKTISYCIKDVSGQVHREGQIGATRRELEGWMKTLPQPWTVAMEATIFRAWTSADLCPQRQELRVAYALSLPALAAARSRTDRIDAGNILDSRGSDSLRCC